jgi:hypothetical protein
LAAGGAEGAAATAEARSFVAERWVLRASAAMLAGACLGLRLRAGPDTGRAAVPHADGEDEYTRECLAVVVARRLSSDDVLQALADLFVERGPPGHIRSDNGPEFVAKEVRGWLGRVGVKTLFIEPGSPWEMA